MTDNPIDGTNENPTDDELAKMSREELVALGGKMDGVETVFKEARWPIEGTKAEKRAERTVAYWLCSAASWDWHCYWCSCSGRGSTSPMVRRASSSTAWPRRFTG